MGLGKWHALPQSFRHSVRNFPSFVFWPVPQLPAQNGNFPFLPTES
jgi:hypothetical protein